MQFATEREEIRLVTWVKVSIAGKLASGHVDFRQASHKCEQLKVLTEKRPQMGEILFAWKIKNGWL